MTALEIACALICPPVANMTTFDIGVLVVSLIIAGVLAFGDKLLDLCEAVGGKIWRP